MPQTFFRCCTCDETNRSQFYDSIKHYCRPCWLERCRKRMANMTPEQRSHRARKAWAKRYGVTLAEYDELISKPCEICGNLGPNHIDHEIEGSYCGVLCGLCNRAIGMLRHDTSIIMAAADYVARTRQQDDD